MVLLACMIRLFLFPVENPNINMLKIYEHVRAAIELAFLNRARWCARQ